MFDAHAFFMKRFSAHMKEMSRYLRYIFNGHIAFAMMFFVSALAYYYQAWLAELPDYFPTAWIMGIVFGLVAGYSPVRTLLKEPDLVFLIAAEHKMGAYFRNALVYSFVTQLYVLLIVAAALGPLYFHSFPDRSGSMYLLTIVVLLIFKVWNMIANWWMLKVPEPGIRLIDQMVRLLLNGAVFFFFIKGDVVWAGIATGLFMLVFLYDFRMSQKQAGITWELLVEKEQSRMQAFYRIANMFTDVPHLKNRIKKRRWIVSLVANVPFAKKYTYDYLYRIAFVRIGDYLDMYIRLMVLGGLFIYFIPNVWMKLAFALLFLYMSSFQMMTLYQHHRTIMWLDIYPVGKDVRQRALLKWLLQLAIVQTVLFAVLFLFLHTYAGFALTLAGGLLFNVLFIFGYVQRKLA